MTLTGIENRVEAIPGTPLPYGLVNAAAVLPISAEHDLGGVEWQSMSCGTAHATDMCFDVDDEDAQKTLDDNRPITRQAPPVTVYAAIDCAVVGLSHDEAVVRAKALLDIGESRALEKWVWDNLLIPFATNESAQAGDTTVVARLGVLEELLATAYGGTGVLHVPVRLGPFLAGRGLLQQRGTRLQTWSGHNVALGAGYPATDFAGTPIAGQTRWMILSGPVVIRRERPFEVPDEEGQAVNVRTNDRVVIAERTSVVQVECAAFAIDVKLSECCE